MKREGKNEKKRKKLFSVCRLHTITRVVVRVKTAEATVISVSANVTVCVRQCNIYQNTDEASHVSVCMYMLESVVCVRERLGLNRRCDLVSLYECMQILQSMSWLFDGYKWMRSMRRIILLFQSFCGNCTVPIRKSFN